MVGLVNVVEDAAPGHLNLNRGRQKKRQFEYLFCSVQFHQQIRGILEGNWPGVRLDGGILFSLIVFAGLM